MGSIGWEGSVGGKKEMREKDIGHCYTKGLIHVTHPKLSLCRDWTEAGIGKQISICRNSKIKF